MANLSTLRSSLNYWNGQVSDLNDKLKNLKKRQSDVENVKNALNSTVNGDSSGVNGKIRSAAGKLGSAVGYSGKDSQLNAILSGKDERTVGSDNCLTSADGDLQRELNDIGGKTTDTNNALAAAKRNAADYKSAVSAEEKRELDESIRKAAEAVANALKK